MESYVRSQQFVIEVVQGEDDMPARTVKTFTAQDGSLFSEMAEILQITYILHLKFLKERTPHHPSEK